MRITLPDWVEKSVEGLTVPELIEPLPRPVKRSVLVVLPAYRKQILCC